MTDFSRGGCDSTWTETPAIEPGEKHRVLADYCLSRRAEIDPLQRFTIATISQMTITVTDLGSARKPLKHRNG